MKRIALILPILLVLASGIVSAAAIEGSIYDIELNSVSNAIVEIDTTPKQSFVSKDGAYSFEVPLGEYTIKAKHEQGVAEEKIIIQDDGRFIIDLILFPDFSEEEELLNESELEISTDYAEETNYSLYHLAGILLALGAFVLVMLKYKKKLEAKLKNEIKEIKEIQRAEKSEVEPGLKELLDFIKKEGGRTTQKDIRRNFPQSEAKISLMVAELEHKGRIKKIKKGRGNIITLI